MHHQWLHRFWGLISNRKTSLLILEFVLTVQPFWLEFTLQFNVKILFDFCYEQPPINHSVKHWTYVLDQGMHDRILLIVVILTFFIACSIRAIFWILAFHCRGEGAFVWGWLLAGVKPQNRGTEDQNWTLVVLWPMSICGSEDTVWLQQRWSGQVSHPSTPPYLWWALQFVLR